MAAVVTVIVFAQVPGTVRGRGEVDRRLWQGDRRGRGRAQRGPGQLRDLRRARRAVQGRPVQPGERRAQRYGAAGPRVQADRHADQDRGRYRRTGQDPGVRRPSLELTSRGRYKYAATRFSCTYPVFHRTSSSVTTSRQTSYPTTHPHRHNDPNLRQCSVAPSSGHVRGRVEWEAGDTSMCEEGTSHLVHKGSLVSTNR